jgi:Ni,Fe-hydrogenase I large subunit
MAAAQGKYKESETFCEIGGFIHQDQGRVKAKMYVGDVNKPLQIDDAELTKRMKKIRVTMNVSEDKSVHQNQVYEKDIEMIQEVIGDPSGKSSGKDAAYSKDATPEMQSGVPSNELTPLAVLKNFLDNVAADNRTQWIAIAGALIIAAVALGLAIFG